MKIAVATSFPALPDAPRGGVEAVSVNLVRALAARRDCEVHVVTLDAAVDSPHRSEWSGATIHRLPRRRSLLLPFVTGAGRRLVREFLARLQPDVIHAHDFYGIMVKGMAVPRVFTIHGFIHEDTRYNNTRFAWLRSQLWRCFEVASWREQPHIISISPYVRERLRGIARGYIHDIENPIAPECFNLARAEEPRSILCAAVVSERKNTLGLVRAFAEVVRNGTDARLRLAGPIVEQAYGNRVKDFVQQNGLSERVSFLGPISAEQVRKELAQASIFALVSFEEGAPMGIAEAMAAGTPVVTSNRCGMPYMVQDGETGFLVEPNAPDAIARRFRILLMDRVLNEQFGARGREMALDRFHPSRVADRTMRVYCACVDDVETETAH